MKSDPRDGGFAVLKAIGYVAGALVLLIAIGAVTVYMRSNTKLKQTFVVQVKPVSVPGDAATIARGKHIAETRGCTECHGTDLGGKTVFNNGPMGRVDAPNLTHGAGGVPANFKDEDYVRAIRHGVTTDGRGLFLMQSEEYSTFSDADMGAVIAFIKNVPPVDRPRGPVALGPIARMLVSLGKIQLAAEKIDHARVSPAVVSPGLTVEYGRYLATGCIGCHGPNFSGGKIAAGPPDWPPAANLTPHADGRLAKWSEADFLSTLRTAKRPDGSELNAAMPRAFGKLEESELKALWMFLKTLPAVPTGAR
jgi:mono/diheme cytochrome c family protein